MARVFSWKLGDKGFGYLAKANGTTSYQITESKITSTSDLKKISDIVGNYSEDKYKSEFNNLRSAALGMGITIDGDYSLYYDVGKSIVMITGEGVEGKEGKPGQKGDTGSAGKGRNIMCYCGLESGFTPTAPRGGSLNLSNWEIEYPTGTTVEDGSKRVTWRDSNEFGEGIIVWVTNADFDEKTDVDGDNMIYPVEKVKDGKTYTWTKPIRITGEKGDNGADGDTIEYIYRRLPKRRELNDYSDLKPGNRGVSRDNPATHEFDGFEKDFIPTDWLDHPEGISLDNRVELMCTHSRASKDVPWSEWYGPILWASWGEDGIDGDGIEYIFAVTENFDHSAVQMKLPKSTDPELAGRWQDAEIWDYIRENGLAGNYAPWTDDPSDVEESQPYEWMSMRKRKWVADEEKSYWGEFSEPKLWAHWGRNGKDGDDGTSLNVIAKYDSLFDLLSALKGGLHPWLPKRADSYAIGVDSVHMWVWMQIDESEANDYEEYTHDKLGTVWTKDTDFSKGFYVKSEDAYWWFVDCGAFQGDSGYTTYMHMKYATDFMGQTYEPLGEDGFTIHRTATIYDKNTSFERDICFTEPSRGVYGETPGPYIAIYSDTMADDIDDFGFYCGEEFNDYTAGNSRWNKFYGEDGQTFGQEQIFFRSFSTMPAVREVTEEGHGYKVGEKILDVKYPDHCFTTNDFIPVDDEGIWTDVPMGLVRGSYNFEFSSTRKLLPDGTWSYFSAPGIYAMASDQPTYQVEYSYFTGETMATTDGKINLINATEFTENGEFDEEGWREANKAYGPWGDYATTDTTWIVEAHGYYENGDTSKLKWHDWTATRTRGFDGPAGTNGYSVYTSFAFTSLDEGINIENVVPKGGNFMNPLPTETWSGETLLDYVVWQDSAPTDGRMIWMTEATFSNENGNKVVKDWSTPTLMKDTTHFEVIYSAIEEVNDVPTGFTKSTIEAELAWFAKANKDGWYDDANQCVDDYGVTGATPIWMATNRMQNNAWGKWEIVKIKGESITDSTAYTILGHNEDISDCVAIGGSFEDRRPTELQRDGNALTGVTWTTQKPNEEDGKTIWFVTGRFTKYTGSIIDQPVEGWSKPTRLVDTTDFEVIYTAYDVPLPIPDNFEKIGVEIETNWENLANANGWFDETNQCMLPSEKLNVGTNNEVYDYTSAPSTTEKGEPVWMATNTMKNEVWSGWQISRAKSLSQFTSFVFCSLHTGQEPNTEITGGTYYNPIPTSFAYGNSVKWQDAMPTNGNVVWMSKAIFSNESGSTFVSAWTTPTKLVDTPDFEVIYTAFIGEEEGDFDYLVDPNDITGFSKTPSGEITTSWLGKANLKGWYDEPNECMGYMPINADVNVNDRKDKSNYTYGPCKPVYMATSRLTNGKWSDWEVCKIKGEKGDDGVSYSLAFDYAVVNVSPVDGKCTPDKIKVTAYKIEGAKTPTSAFTDATIHYEIRKNETITNSATINNGGEITGYNSATTSINVYLKKDGNPIITDTVAFVHDATNVFTSYAFAAVDNGYDISHYTPTGGSTTDAKPNASTVKAKYSITNNNSITTGETDITVTWLDSAPAEDATKTIWMTQGKFVDQIGYSKSTTWSNPVKMTDTPDFEVIYNTQIVYNNKVASYPAIPNGFSKIGADIDATWLTNAQTNGWTDDSDGNAVWMATNKREHGIWQGWSVARIKGEDGGFVSTVFCRDNGTPAAPSGGTYDNPQPEKPKNKWTDGIPTGTAQLWASTYTFKGGVDYGTGVNQVYPKWSTPTPMTDTVDFEVIYSPTSAATAPEIPTGFSKNGVVIDATWLNKAKSKGWYDNTTDFEGDAIWMATNKAKNGVWNNTWEVNKIKGEKGEKGGDGGSGPTIVYRGTYSENETYVGNNRVVNLVKYNDKCYATLPSTGTISGEDTKPTEGQDNEYWLYYGEYQNFVATELLLADNAIIENGLIRKLRTNDPNTETGGQNAYIHIEGNELQVYDDGGAAGASNNLVFKATGNYYNSNYSFANNGSSLYLYNNSGQTTSSSCNIDTQEIVFYQANYQDSYPSTPYVYTNKNNNIIKVKTGYTANPTTGFTIETSSRLDFNNSLNVKMIPTLNTNISASYGTTTNLTYSLSVNFYVENNKTNVSYSLGSTYGNVYKTSYSNTSSITTNKSDSFDGEYHSVAMKDGMTLPPGTYVLKYNITESLSGYENQKIEYGDGENQYGMYPEGSVLTEAFTAKGSTSIVISGNTTFNLTPVSEYVETFANGFGYKYTQDEYFVVLSPGNKRTDSNRKLEFDLKSAHGRLQLNSSGLRGYDIKTNASDYTNTHTFFPIPFACKVTSGSSRYSISYQGQANPTSGSVTQNGTGDFTVHVYSNKLLYNKPMSLTVHDENFCTTDSRDEYLKTCHIYNTGYESISNHEFFKYDNWVTCVFDGMADYNSKNAYNPKSFSLIIYNLD